VGGNPVDRIFEGEDSRGSDDLVRRLRGCSVTTTQLITGSSTTYVARFVRRGRSLSSIS